MELVAFYCRVGIVFSGRQAPGGHNVIWGLYEALKVHNAKNILLGFLGMLCFLISVTFFFALRSDLTFVLSSKCL